MVTRIVALLLTLGVLGFAGVFVWGALRPAALAPTSADASVPTATVSELLSDGRLDVQVYALGNRDIRLEMQFEPDTRSSFDSAEVQPDVFLMMENMNMDGFYPPLERRGPGAWRSSFKVTMDGRWVVNAGFGEEFTEVAFDAR